MSTALAASPSRFFSAHRLPRRDNTAAPPNPVSQLLYIAPTSNTCSGAAYPSECAVSSLSVVQDIVNSFAQYNVTTAAEQAALLSWMVYESGEFKYNHNHFPAPGTPGKGTRTMMSPTFVQQYANSIPELQAKVAAIGTGASLTDAQADQVLALVQPDQYSFAAAAWYYGTHCTDAQKAQVRQGGQQNWQTAFITGCVGTTVDDGRVSYWQKACEALAVPVTP
ncbi:uncharacterized protein Z520_05373 [Fonsecaea multimorphosa CBS 102226]|uniref:Uncharacterized protein n=1 Tax=Fonsecaea multimorphosa CBS 102226 TaxID=1442371 RepID=A0A0D2JZJ3_9EURO|nr:uncharacterized protein Z520_05373 [Fonsecaea multimorphosa CBS 102226]KIX98912.1 hypothetical protein Z520_05373 [Fonsecaea multimorphosa CBS 102226]OAL25187.1 hypothetical protein AYO22_05064 [Fonsecaea multimorphosa]